MVASRTAPSRSRPAAVSQQERRQRVLQLAAPALTYLGVRLAGVLILATMASANGTSLAKSLTAWDGQWYLAIAKDGYASAAPWLTDANGSRTGDTPLAFFPGYPSVVGFLDGFPFVGLGFAAYAVTIGFGVLAAYGVYRIGLLIPHGSRRVGLILVALFAASPMGVVLSMTYSESMFCALAAWALAFVLERRWVAAGAVCALAGLVRPTALALVITVGVAALVFALRHRQDRAGAIAGMLLAPVGLVGYVWWAGARMRPDGDLFEQLGAWSALQRSGWGSWFDGGAATVDYTLDTLARSESVLNVVTVAVLFAAIALVAVSFADKVPWPLVVYGLGVLLMDIGSNGLMNSKARLLLPAFTLLIPIAIALARRRPRTALSVLCAVTAASGWFGAHALVIWNYAI